MLFRRVVLVDGLRRHVCVMLPGRDRPFDCRTCGSSEIVHGARFLPSTHLFFRLAVPFSHVTDIQTVWPSRLRGVIDRERRVRVAGQRLRGHIRGGQAKELQDGGSSSVLLHTRHSEQSMLEGSQSSEQSIEWER